MINDVLFIGIEVGHYTRSALVDCNGNIVWQKQVQIELNTKLSLGKGLLDLIDQTRRATTIQVAGIGIGLPGLINHYTKHIEILPNLAVSSLDIHQNLEEITGLPVILENDANAGAYGEWKCGAAQGAQNIVYIMMGTGIGSGIILGSQLQYGTSGFAGEIGHIKIGNDTLECSCGRVGCLETIASGPNIVRRTRELLFTDPRFMHSSLANKMKGRLTSEDILIASNAKDELACSVLSETAQYIGIAISNMVNLLNVEKVILGGPMMKSGKFLLETLQTEVDNCSFSPILAQCKIILGKLGNNAVIIGSSMLVRDSQPVPQRGTQMLPSGFF